MEYPPDVDPAKPIPGEPAREDVERAWRDEIRRRAAELDAGRARLVDGDVVLAELRRLIDDHRG